MIAELLTRLRFFLSREPREALNEELRFHLEQATQTNITAGLTPEEARRQALIAFGGVERTREQAHAQHPRWFLATIAQDIRYALRQLRKAPGFAITAILTLALGIGATTAIFTLVQQVLLKSLPVVNPSQLWRVGDGERCCLQSGMENDWSMFSYEQYKRFRDNTPGFSQLAAFQAGSNQIGVRRAGSHHPAESFISEFVSGNAFDTLGLRAYAGRLLQSSDDRTGAVPAAVMSDRAWRQKFGQDPSVVGAAFVIDGQPFTIVGIAPPGFFGARLTNNPASFWIPIHDEPLLDGAASAVLNHPEMQWLDLIGRLQPGANPRQVEARMQVELRQFLLDSLVPLDVSARPLIPRQTLRLNPGGGGIRTMQRNYKDGLHLLMWISGFVLLIACANLANLMLVRAAARKHQMSVRSALGAPRARLVRQAMTESLVLALLGGVAGIGVAYSGAALIIHLAFHRQYIPIHAAPSWPVLGFTFAVSLLTGLLFGAVPAWRIARADPVDALKQANRTTTHSGLWTQKALVVVQAAVSLALLCAAGLLTQSLRNMQHQRFGFATAHRYILHINPQMYKPDQLAAFYRELHDSLAAIPGVQSVSFSIYSPMDGNNWGEGIYIEGHAPPPPGSDENDASWNRVSAGYFATLGTRMIAGRPITEQDTASSRPVAVVNSAFAKKFFRGGAAIGGHFSDQDEKHAGTYEIVGVTENTQYGVNGPLGKVRPMYFLPATQNLKSADPRYSRFQDSSHYLGAIEIETRGQVPNLEQQARRAISQINPNLTVIDFQPFAEQVREYFNQQAMIARLTSLFGILALVLAAIGLYGVTAYTVERRTSEIGIRMALGAGRGNVLAIVLRGAFLQIAIGLLIGIPIALLGGRAMTSQLFGVKPYDPLILATATLLLGLAALIASLVPARRAASIDPMLALRAE